MALTARLQLRQAQSLVMTPQLLQSIRLLQFTRAELDQFIDDQTERNPLLERAADEAADAAPPSDIENGADTSSRAMADQLDTSLENVFPDDPGRDPATGAGLSSMPGASPLSSGAPSRAASPFSQAGHDWTPDHVAAPQMSLRATITEQIALAFDDPADRAIAVHLTDALDERGYFDGEPDQMAAMLDVDVARIASVLETLRGFDPAGVFARDLADCLALQCARRNRLDPAMAALLDNLELLAQRDFPTLSRLCGVQIADLIDMMAEIRTLDPRPASAFDDSPVQSIVHDAQVRAAPDGTWLVELNGDAMPRVLVDRAYHARVTRGGLDEDGRAFMTQCLQDASWLERSLDQRANTILKVATEIVRQQDGFLAHGISALRPLTMKAVASEIDMHESTISRVVANKYLMTPRGIFEFRFFFAGAVGGGDGDGEAHASQSVRERIRTLIGDEAIENVLSDDALVGLLREEGVDIARRTVAKYREAMNIASSVQRRREKRALALAAD